MADDLEEEPHTYRDFASTKVPIFDALNKLKKWREEQIQQFRNQQYLDNQNVIKLIQNNDLSGVFKSTSKSAGSEDRGRNPTSENSDTSSISLRNDFENFDIPQESSITGHLQRCFDDSSRSSLSVTGSKIDISEKNENFREIPISAVAAKNISENPKQQMTDNANSMASNKPKRPFLRKGSGLQRYMPKSSVCRRPTQYKKPLTTNATQKTSPCFPQKTLHLKPALRKTDVPSGNVKHIKFDVPLNSSNESEENENICDVEQDPEFNSNVKAKSCYTSSNSPDHNSQKRNELRSESSPESEGLNLSDENKSLEVFEMLENCAQNSSFNSESSVVQRLLLGDSPKSVPVAGINLPKVNLNNNMQTSHGEIYRHPSINSIFSPKFGLSKCLEEAHARKEYIQKEISDINPRIHSLQKEIARSQKEFLDDSDVSDRCSTPVSDINVEDRNIILSQVSDIDPPVFCESPSLEIPYESGDGIKSALETSDQSCNINDYFDLYPDNDNKRKEDSTVEDSSNMKKSDTALNEQNLLRSKCQELEKEIKTYQEMNAKLSSFYKERDEFLGKLQKERDDFHKYKEAEEKKLKDEIEEARRQIKRQKETFTRYQKLRKDNPTRKERDEMNSLRQEIEKLQEELKRQKIKYNSDSRRWKNQLEVAEKERDNFKLENIKLEEQCQDLLATLKTRMKKKPDAKFCDKTEESSIEKTNQSKESVMMKDAEAQTDKINLNSDISENCVQISPKNLTVKKTKSKVRFNLYPDFYRKELETVVEEAENKTKDQQSDDRFLAKVNSEVPVDHLSEEVDIGKNPEVNLSTISFSAESEFKEIDHGNKIEKIYNSGEREVIYNSGTRKIISLDGKSKFLFYNGDTKEIFPDKREVYRFVNGTVETIFPDGLIVTEFPSGEIQRRHPDGQHEVKFVDGTLHNIFADGSEVIKLVDGNMVKRSADGTKITEFSNGQKEIRTATYTRREFPDGAVKIIYDTGRQETRYPDGRIRIKDKKGKVLYDTKYLTKKD